MNNISKIVCRWRTTIGEVRSSSARQLETGWTCSWKQPPAKIRLVSLDQESNMRQLVERLVRNEIWTDIPIFSQTISSAHTSENSQVAVEAGGRHNPLYHYIRRRGSQHSGRKIRKICTSWQDPTRRRVWLAFFTQVTFGRVTRSDSSFVFRHPDCQCVHVAANLRLAWSSHF